MATSSKFVFELSELQKQAVSAIDERIELKQKELRTYEDPDEHDKVVRAWRERQEAKIATVFHRLGDFDIADEELAQFRLEPFPKQETYRHERAARELAILQARRSQMTAKTRSIKPSDDGTISLTKTQLKEFFDL